MSDLFQRLLWLTAGGVIYVAVYVGLDYFNRRRSRPRGIQFPRDVLSGPQACSVCHLQTSELVDGKCPDHDAYEFFDRPCLWTPPEIKHDGPATSHTIADCASKFDNLGPTFISGGPAPFIPTRPLSEMGSHFTLPVPEVHPGDLVRRLNELFGLPVPTALRAHPATLDYLRSKLGRVDAETCPNPFWGITMHSDREVDMNVVVPMNADEELVWLRKRDGTCAVCDREASLVDGECPDCRH